MVNGAFNLSPDPNNFAFQRRDAGVKLADRQPVEILADEVGQRVAGPQRGVVGFHATSVDRGPRDVNNGVDTGR